jgi:hypothetical protein
MSTVRKRGTVEEDLLTFLERRSDEGAQIMKHFEIFDIAKMKQLNRRYKAWGDKMMRKMIGNNGKMIMGQKNLTLDLVNFSIEHDDCLVSDFVSESGSTFFTGVRLFDSEKRPYRLLIRTTYTNYTLVIDEEFRDFTFKSKMTSARLSSTFHNPGQIVRPLVLPFLHEINRLNGLLIVSPSIHTPSDFVSFYHLNKYVHFGEVYAEDDYEIRDYLYPEDPDFNIAEELYEVSKYPEMKEQLFRNHILYDSALYIPELKGVVYSNFNTVCFRKYNDDFDTESIRTFMKHMGKDKALMRKQKFRLWFKGPIWALPLSRAVTFQNTPVGLTFAYNSNFGTLIAVGGRRDTGRKFETVYEFPLAQFIKQHPSGNSIKTELGIFTEKYDENLKFSTIGYLTYPRICCGIRFGLKGRLMIIYGGKGVRNSSPSMIEIFYLSPTQKKWLKFQKFVTSPDVVIC